MVADRSQRKVAFVEGGDDGPLPGHVNRSVISCFLNAAIAAFSVIVHMKAACQKH